MNATISFSIVLDIIVLSHKTGKSKLVDLYSQVFYSLNKFLLPIKLQVIS